MPGPAIGLESRSNVEPGQDLQETMVLTFPKLLLCFQQMISPPLVLGNTHDPSDNSARSDVTRT
jgi:hypothetical protein